MKRVDAIDAEVRASGITRQDEKDLLIEISKETMSESQLESEDGDEDEYSVENSSLDEELSEENQELSEENEDLPEKCEIPNKSNIQEDITTLRKQVDISTSAVLGEPLSAEDLKKFEWCSLTDDKATQNIPSPKLSKETNQEYLGENLDADNFENNGRKSPAYTASVAKTPSRYAPSSVASTIAPEVIKARVKASLEKRKRAHQMKRIRTKGDTSGITRARNDNQNEIKTSTDAFWGD